MDGRHVGVDHHLNEFLKRGAGHPPKFLLRESGVADEQVNFSGAEELGIGADANNTVLVGGDGVDAFTRPCQVHADVGKSEGNHVANAVGSPGCDDVIAWLVLLEHAPLHLNIVAGKAPVALGINVADPQALVKTVSDACCSHGNFSGNEFKATARALVVEENPRAGEHVVGFAVVTGDFEREHFRTTVR